MISATVLACALSGVDRSVTSWPAAARLSEALKVANRTSLAWLAVVAVMAAVVATRGGSGGRRQGGGGESDGGGDGRSPPR